LLTRDSAGRAGARAGPATSGRVGRITRDKQLDTPELSSSDCILLCFTAEMVQQPRVSDEVSDQARKFFTERELVEVLQAVGYCGRLLAVRLADACVSGRRFRHRGTGRRDGDGAGGGKLREDATRLDLRVLLCGPALQLVSIRVLICTDDRCSSFVGRERYFRSRYQENNQFPGPEWSDTEVRSIRSHQQHEYRQRIELRHGT
jgi:hypothetical protein